jgi:hypothetical protein
MAFLKKPKKLQWTAHAQAKMRQYGLSQSRLQRVMHTPARVEEGIAPDTVAMMQPASLKIIDGKRGWNQEIWVMFADAPDVRRIVSAWRYPGQTKLGTPLPPEILRELRALL